MNIWYVPQIGSTLVLASLIFFEKDATKQENTPLAFLLSFIVMAGPIFLFGVAVLPIPSFSTIIYGVMSGTLFLCAASLYYMSIAKGDVVILVIVLRVSILVELALNAFLFGDILTDCQYWAAGLIVVGTVIPILSSREILVSKFHDSGILLMITASILLALSEVLAKQISTQYGFGIAVTWTQGGQFLVFCLLMGFFPKPRQRLIQSLKDNSGTFWGTLITTQFMRQIATILSYQAVYYAQSAALATSLSGIRPVITLIFAWCRGSKLRFLDLLALVFVTVGTLLLFLS